MTKQILIALGIVVGTLATGAAIWWGLFVWMMRTEG